MTTLLIAGFGRFPGAPFNPSGLIATRLARSPRLTGLNVVAHVFPTSYAAVDRDLPKLIAKHKPDALVIFGLAGRTQHVRIETRARNTRSLCFPDVDGFIPAMARIDASAPAALNGRAPFRRLLAAARTTRVKTALSRDAGRYLCNYIYWRAIEVAEASGGPRLVVFIHVPNARSGPRAKRGKHRPKPSVCALAHAGEAIVRAVITALRAPQARQPASPRRP